MSESTIEAPQ
jgi:hypothetical protein